MEREQLRAASTLVVTVKSSDEFHDHVTDGIESLEQGDAVDASPTLSFTSYDDLMETLTPRVLNSSRPFVGTNHRASTRLPGLLTET
jgi:predicted transcriptional regulator